MDLTEFFRMSRLIWSDRTNEQTNGRKCQVHRVCSRKLVAVRLMVNTDSKQMQTVDLYLVFLHFICFSDAISELQNRSLLHSAFIQHGCGCGTAFLMRFGVMDEFRTSPWQRCSWCHIITVTWSGQNDQITPKSCGGGWPERQVRPRQKRQTFERRLKSGRSSSYGRFTKKKKGFRGWCNLVGDWLRTNYV